MPDRAWPVVLSRGEIRLRPGRRLDARAWAGLRADNAAWLAPWDATHPPIVGSQTLTFGAYVSNLRRLARQGLALPWVLEVSGRLAGQVTISAVTLSSIRSGSVGYWISEHLAGRGIIPLAVAMAVDHALGPGALHRIEIAIRPENRPSLRVAAKLGLRDEGIRERYMHVAGSWTDHRIFAITQEELGPGLVARLTDPPVPAA